VADRGNWFAGIDELLDEPKRFLVDPQCVGIHHPAGKDESVEVVRLRLAKRQVNGELIAMLVMVKAPYVRLIRIIRNGKK